MSRLYLDTMIDGVANSKRHCANEEIFVKVLWGSAKEPRIAFTGTVRWKKGTDEPVVIMSTNFPVKKGTEIHDDET